MQNYYEVKKASGGAVEDAEPYFLTSNFVAQEKLDGCRYVVHYGLDETVRIYSRNASKKTGEVAVDKTTQLQHIADEVKHIFPPGTVLDGEIIAPSKSGNSHSTKVTSVTGASPEKSLAYQREHGFVEYAVFDILASEGTDLTELPYIGRLEFLETLRLLDTAKSAFHIFLLPFTAGEDHKRALLAKIWKRGGEGIILKDINAPYNPKRDKAWVKVKREREYDVVFMGVEAAKEKSVKKGDASESATKYAGLAGAIIFGQYDADDTLFGQMKLKELGTVSGFDDAMRHDITENAKKYIGRVFTIKGQERTKNMSVRHPRFIQWRDDKPAQECIIRPDEA